MSWNLGDTARADILLVEDNTDDVMLTRLAFEQARAPVSLHTVGGGAECLRFLRRAPPWVDAPRPDLVLLDLNMPGMDGRATLAAIGADEQLRSIPVIVLTTSTREEDVAEMYRLRCAGYVVKPVDLDRFFAVIGAVCAYWLDAVRLPVRLRTRG
jgi:CheY-like chemotaxis protein